MTYFKIPLCKSRALEGREDRNSLRKVTIFPRFLATKMKEKQVNTNFKTKKASHQILTMSYYDIRDL